QPYRTDQFDRLPMKEKEQREDILKEILSGPQNETVLGLEELRRLIYQVSIPEKTPVTPARKGPSEKPRSKKKKTTHYLSEQTFINLEEVKQKLKLMLPDDKKTKVSKSRIVNDALELILKEFVAKGEESFLMKKISRRSEKD
ncbi:MAG: hypothetical protein AB1659_06705, partial [Thermodesulfobacteriota bacterium]